MEKYVSSVFAKLGLPSTGSELAPLAGQPSRRVLTGNRLCCPPRRHAVTGVLVESAPLSRLCPDPPTALHFPVQPTSTQRQNPTQSAAQAAQTLPTADRYRLSRLPGSCGRVAPARAGGESLPDRLSGWEKTGPSIHRSATMRNHATAARVKGTVDPSRSASWLSANAPAS